MKSNGSQVNIEEKRNSPGFLNQKDFRHEKEGY